MTLIINASLWLKQTLAIFEEAASCKLAHPLNIFNPNAWFAFCFYPFYPVLFVISLFSLTKTHSSHHLMGDVRPSQVCINTQVRPTHLMDLPPGAKINARARRTHNEDVLSTFIAPWLSVACPHTFIRCFTWLSQHFSVEGGFNEFPFHVYRAELVIARIALLCSYMFLCHLYQNHTVYEIMHKKGNGLLMKSWYFYGIWNAFILNYR